MMLVYELLIRLSLAGMGDYPYVTLDQFGAVVGMTRVAYEICSQAVISTGDNFFDLEPEGPSLARFNFTWMDVYNTKALDTIWFIVAGAVESSLSPYRSEQFARIS
jgi:hypothetical protein